MVTQKMTFQHNSIFDLVNRISLNRGGGGDETVALTTLGHNRGMISLLLSLSRLLDFSFRQNEKQKNVAKKHKSVNRCKWEILGSAKGNDKRCQII